MYKYYILFCFKHGNKTGDMEANVLADDAPAIMDVLPCIAVDAIVAGGGVAEASPACLLFACFRIGSLPSVYY